MAPVTFILRIGTNEAGGLTGILERVKTGDRHRFYGIDALQPLLVRLLTQESAETAGEQAQSPAAEAT